MSKHFVGFSSVAMVLLLCVCSGCGTAEYEKRLGATKGRLSTESPFELMYQSTAIPGTRVEIRVPQYIDAQRRDFFKAAPLVEGSAVDGKPVDPRRLKPPLAELADVKLTYEGSIEDGDHGWIPYYCYLAVTDLSKRGKKDQTLWIQQRLRNALPDSTDTWKDVACKSPTGQMLTWKKLRSTGKQEFYYVDPDGNGRFIEIDGLMEFYSRTEGNFLIVIGWRMPESLEALVKLKEWAPRVAGSVTLEPVDPEEGGVSDDFVAPED